MSQNIKTCSKPRVIIITGCLDCKHSEDYSSGGLECNKLGGRTIIQGYGNRSQIKHAVPVWCPLTLYPE